MEDKFGSSSSQVSTSANLQIKSLQDQVSNLQTSNDQLTAQVDALTTLVQSQQADIQSLVDSHRHLQMQNSVALGAIIGKLNIPLPALLEAVRSEIPTLIMHVYKPKGEIEVKLAKSSTQHVQGVDVDMERLIRAAEGPSLSREFDDLLRVLKASLDNNFFTYKKTLDRTINFIRVILVTTKNTLM